MVKQKEKRQVLMNKKDAIITDSVYACPVCSENVIRVYDNFCSCCGTPLKWSEND